MIDFSNDTNGQDLHKFCVQFGQTKIANQVEVPDDLDDRAFANPHSRELPTHTKEATLQSSIYFYGNKLNGNTWDSNYPEELVEARLEKAAKFWSVVPDFNEIRDYRPPVEKSAYTNVEYAIEDQKLLPIHTEEALVKSASSLVESGSELDFYTRSKAASVILTRDYNTGEEGVLQDNLRADLEKMAGLNPKPATEAKKNVTMLAHNYDEPLKGSLMKLASLIEDESQYVDYCLAIDATIEKKAFAVEDLFYNRGEMHEPTLTLPNGKEVKVASIKKAGTDPFAVLGDAIPFNVSDGKKLDYKKAEIFLSNMSKPDSDLYYKALNSFLG
jgi:hypothetical protein